MKLLVKAYQNWNLILDVILAQVYLQTNNCQPNKGNYGLQLYQAIVCAVTEQNN